MHYNYNMLLSLYFIVPLFWILLTIIFITIKPLSILRWLLLKTTRKTKAEIQTIDRYKFNGLYRYLRNWLITASAITLSFAVIACAPGVPKLTSDFWNANLFFFFIGLICLSTSFSKAASIGSEIFRDDKTNKKKESYISEGMLIGMTLGSALGLTLFGNVSIVMTTGMCFGMLIGVNIPKNGTVK